MKKEIMIYIGLFLFLAIGMHFKQWTSIPMEHLNNLTTAGAYGLGANHPFIFTLAAYVAVGIPRVLVKIFSNKNKKAKIM